MCCRLALMWLLLTGCATGYSGEKGPGLVPFGPEGMTERVAQPKRFALLVGIEDFDDERFKDLRYAAADARALAMSLASFDDVKLLTGPDQTHRAAVLAALAELDRMARDPQDTVFIYFSTHGSLAREPGGKLERYLVTRDTRMNVLPQTGIRVDDMLQAVEAMRSRRKVLVLATCHSGKGKSQVDDELARVLDSMKSATPHLPLAEVSEATIILTACAFGETARESDQLGHDIYTFFFLEALGLGTGDRNSDGAVTASEAHDYARERTYAFTGGVQRPTAESEILGIDPIVLSGEATGAGLPVLYSYAASAEGLEVVVDGRVKGTLPGGVAVDQGAHQLELRNGATGASLYRGDIAVTLGQSTNLTELIPDPFAVVVLVSGGGFFPVMPGVAIEYLPLGFAFDYGTRLRNWPFHRAEATARLSYCGGPGQATGFGEALPFWGHLIHAELGAGYAYPVQPDIFLTPGVGVGMLWAVRSFDTAHHRGTETLRGSSVGAQLALEWQPLDGLWVVPTLEGGALLAQLGDGVGPHPYLGLRIGVGVGF